jgi:hypothetical protein
MNDQPLRIEIEGRRLDVVPAVHFRAVFAEQVNQLCANQATRPKAIAVELGPETCAAAATFLRDLGVGPDRREKLPCMLGLTKLNRRLRTSVRERAVNLQRTRGQSLHELPPRLLLDELGYSALTVFFLSPTDSIVEAIRCALELGIPLYGVDLEETAGARRSEILIEDPEFAFRNPEAYVLRNAAYAEAQRDDEIDSRRELAMAARLKHVLSATDGPVLFTGGLAHWMRLNRMLKDPSIRPAKATAASEITPRGFEQVLVHPVLASYHMDVFPAFAQSYQTRRLNPSDPDSDASPDRHVDVAATFSKMLEAVYREHFQADGDGREDGHEHEDLTTRDQREQIDRRLEDLEARTDFEQLLRHLCLLNQCSVPDLFSALLAAEGTMSLSFRKLLAAKLMRFTWATPEQFPTLPLLAPAALERGDYLRAELMDPDAEGGFRRRGEWVYIHANPGRAGQRIEVVAPWEWPFSGSSDPPPPTPGLEDLSWPPNNYLLGAMSLRAMQIAVDHRKEARVLPFEGGLGDGLDIKATLRSQAKGEDIIFIREQARRKTSGGDNEIWDPVVWLLRPRQKLDRKWQIIGYSLERLRLHAKDVGKLEMAAERFGVRGRRGYMIEATGIGRRFHGGSIPEGMAVPDGLRRCDTVSCFDYDGILNFTPPFLDAQQQVALAEENHFRKRIFTPDADVSYDLPEYMLRLYQEHFNIKLDSSNWPVTLVRMGIPLAQEAVTVIAPDSFELPRSVYEDATRHQVKVRVIPHSYFPKDILRRLGQIYWVPPAAEDGALEFDECYHRVLGEAPDTFRNLVPRRWLEYAVQRRT